MRKVNKSALRYVVWTLLIMALIVYSSIPMVFAQAQGNDRSKEATAEMQKAVMRQQVLDQIGMDRARFVEGLIGRWVSLTNDKGAELRNALMALSDDRLADASGADTMKALNERLFGPDNLGDQSSDLVFNKVTPCRIIDTRNAGGILIAGVPRNFDANGPFTAQGGSSTTCGLPSGDPAALVLTVTAVTPTGAGNLRAYPKDSGVPNASTVNYVAGQNIANTTIVPLKQDAGDALEFTVSANVSNSHLVADVVGYFWAPSATPVDCVTNFTSQGVVGGGSWQFTTADCSSERILTGGGVNIVGGCSNNVFILQNSPTPLSTAWSTRGLNQCASQISVELYARCCRLPGL